MGDSGEGIVGGEGGGVIAVALMSARRTAHVARVVVRTSGVRPAEGGIRFGVAEFSVVEVRIAVPVAMSIVATRRISSVAS